MPKMQELSTFPGECQPAKHEDYMTEVREHADTIKKYLSTYTSKELSETCEEGALELDTYSLESMDDAPKSCHSWRFCHHSRASREELSYFYDQVILLLKQEQILPEGFDFIVVFITPSIFYGSATAALQLVSVHSPKSKCVMM